MFGERQASTLLRKAIKDGILDFPEKKILRELDDKNKRKCYRQYLAWRKKNLLHLSTHQEMAQFLIDHYRSNFSKIETMDGSRVWNLAGHPENPVLLLVKNGPEPLHPEEEEKITYKNVHFLHFKNNRVYTSGGGKDMINFYYHTHHLHLQPDRLIQKNDLKKIWASQKLVSLIKKLMPGEGVSFEKKVDLVVKHFSGLSCIDEEVVFDILQTYWCSVDPEYHTKPVYYNLQQSCRLISEKNPDLKEEIKEFLRMKKVSKKSKFKIFLEVVLTELIKKEIPKPKFSDTVHSINKELFSVDPGIISEWEKSPLIPTDHFVEQWLSNYDPEKVGEAFEGKLKNCHLLDSFPTLTGRVVNIPQRSQEWLQTHQTSETNNTFRSISPSMEKGEILSRRYNLVGGNIMEAVVLDYISKKNDLVQVGMITGSKDYSPDGLIVKEDKIVPVEVKTIMGKPGMTHSFLRDYDMARLQLRGVAQVINEKSDKKIAQKGIGYFAFVYPSEGKYMFDIYTIEYDLV